MEPARTCPWVAVPVTAGAAVFTGAGCDPAVIVALDAELAEVLPPPLEAVTIERTV